MTAMTDARSWVLLIPAPAPLWSTNDSHRHGPRATSANRVEWRQAGYVAAQIARLPKRLERVRFAITFHFPDNIRRDALNYSETAKPVIDAWGPPFFQAPTKKAPKGKSAPGWTLIPDDTPEHLESTSLAIGPLWADVLSGLPERERRRLSSPYGGLTAVITDLSPRLEETHCHTVRAGSDEPCLLGAHDGDVHEDREGEYRTIPLTEEAHHA